MARLLQNQHFLHHLLGLRLVAEVGLVDRFDCNHLLGELVQREVDLSERTLPKDLAYSVEFNCGGWNSLSALERGKDVSLQLSHEFHTRRQAGIVGYRVMRFQPVFSDFKVVDEIIHHLSFGFVFLGKTLRCLVLFV